MHEQITVNRVESIPSDADIQHFDELSEQAKEHLIRMHHGTECSRVESDALVELTQCDVIKFTEYVEISMSESAVHDRISA